MPTWYSTADSTAVDRVRAAWNDAPVENLETLMMLLEVARDQVIAYAPAPAAGVDLTVTPQTRHVLAQLRHARRLWDAGRVDASGNIGDGGFTFTPAALDKATKQIIRPANGKPRVL